MISDILILNTISAYQKGLITTNDFMKVALSTKSNFIAAGMFLNSCLEASKRSEDADSFLVAKQAFANFIHHPEHRLPQYLSIDRTETAYALKQVQAGPYNDPVSKILRNEITAEQQAVLDSIAKILTTRHDLDGFAGHLLTQKEIKAYIASGQISLEQVLENPTLNLTLLSKSIIRDCLLGKLISMKQLINLSPQAFLPFSHKSVVEGLITGKIAINEVLNATAIAEPALKTDSVKAKLACGFLSLSQVMSMSTTAHTAIELDASTHFISKFGLSTKQVLSISELALRALHTPTICDLLTTGRIALEQVLNINETALWILKNGILNTELSDGSVSLARILGTNQNFSQAYNDYYIQQLMAEGNLSLIQLLDFKKETLDAFNNQVVRINLTRGHITYHDVINGKLTTSGQNFPHLCVPRHLIGSSSTSDLKVTVSYPVLQVASEDKPCLNITPEFPAISRVTEALPSPTTNLRSGEPATSTLMLAAHAGAGRASIAESLKPSCCIIQ